MNDRCISGSPRKIWRSSDERCWFLCHPRFGSLFISHRIHVCYVYIYGNIYHQYIPNVSIYTIHGSYGCGRCGTIISKFRRTRNHAPATVIGFPFSGDKKRNSSCSIFGVLTLFCTISSEQSSLPNQLLVVGRTLMNVEPWSPKLPNGMKLCKSIRTHIYTCWWF